MLSMPFQVLGIWLPGTIAVVLLAAGASLLYAWHIHRQSYVTENLPAATMPAPDQGKASDPEIPRQQTVVSRVDWQFGFNRETAYLLGGLALAAWCLVGRWINPIPLWRRAGNEPKDSVSGVVQRIRRPDGTELHVELYGP